MELISIQDYSFFFPGEEQPTLRNITTSFKQGDFIVICGPSGSGKSTLLRQMKKQISPHGRMIGKLLYNDNPISEMNDDAFVSDIGFVFQDPENQIVMENVLHELVFGLENLGLPSSEMKRRVAELIQFFGIQDFLDQKTSKISGGQKQILNIASVLLMQPHVLLLDEPTSQLDPVHSKELIQFLHRLNEEFGMTIIVVEHRLNDLLPIADQFLMMDNGMIMWQGTPKSVIHECWHSGNQYLTPLLPVISRLYYKFLSASDDLSVPISVKEGREAFSKLSLKVKSMNQYGVGHVQDRSILSCKDVYFSYERHSPIFTDLSLTIQQNDYLCIVGQNGSGKSTFIKLLAGILKPHSGKIQLKNKPISSIKNEEIQNTIGYLSQSPKAYFLHDTVEQELQYSLSCAQKNVSNGIRKKDCHSFWLGKAV